MEELIRWTLYVLLFGVLIILIVMFKAPALFY